MGKPIKTIEDLRQYCLKRAAENMKRANSAYGEDVRWHWGKADTYTRIAEKLSDLDPAQKSGR